jgi:hypothetical protein
MSSGDMNGNGGNGARDERIVSLSGQGWTVRAIAAEVGLGRSRVHEIVAAAAVIDDDAEDDDEDLFDAELDDEAVPYDIYEPIPPFRFVGLALAEDRKGEPLCDGDGVLFPPAPRAIDGNGVSVPNIELELWRWCAHADAEGDYAAAEAVRADWAAQLAAAGVSCDERGRWVQD